MIIVAIITGLFFGVLVLYFIVFQLGVRSSKKGYDKIQPVSVIIAAKNEESNIKACLKSIIKQDYSSFEIILVDDHSSDQTSEIARKIQTEFPDLKITKAKGHGKKSAIKQGILESQNEYLLFTDADCQVRSSYWINRMMSYFDQDTSIVLGYSPYQLKKSLTNYIQQYETLLTACLYVSAVHYYRPYMAVGRNLAYRKSVFTESSRFNKHLNLLSGDDDLFIQEMATPKNTKVCLDAEAFVESKPANNLKFLFRQKLRHISTADHYRWKDKFLLSLFHFARFGILLAFLLLIILTDQQLIATIGLLSYFIVLQVAFFRPCRKLSSPKINWYIPLLELFLVVFHITLLFYKLFSSKKIRWK